MVILKKTKKEIKKKNQEKNFSVLEQMKFRNVLRKPFLTEKSQDLGKQNKYVFLVDLKATKPLIKRELEKRYNVKVKDVNIVNHKGKMKTWRNVVKRQTALKKAIITLKAGQKIEIY